MTAEEARSAYDTRREELKKRNGDSPGVSAGELAGSAMMLARDLLRVAEAQQQTIASLKDRVKNLEAAGST